MDTHTLDKLEFGKIREILAEHASCALGKEMAAKVKPATRRDLIEQWQRQVAEMIAVSAEHGLPPFGGIRDIRTAIRAAVPPHVLEPADFAVLAETFDATREVVHWAARLPDGTPTVQAMCDKVGDLKALGDAIHKVIDGSGEVRDSASAKLAKLRAEIANARITIQQVVDRLLRDRGATRWLRYSEATFHDDRLVLPLAAEHRGRIPGIVHRSSDSGATLFVEPAEAVELNNRIISLKTDEQREIGRLLWNLTHQIHQNQAEILGTLEALAILDVVCAKVRFARSYQLNPPRIAQDRKLLLRQARHPLLVQMQKAAARIGEQREVVPIDVRLGDDFDVLIITGPNTGGKTVTLKTVALCCAMAAAGLPVSAAAGSVVPVFADILVDIGDEQSLQQSLSTFSAHLKRIMAMLERAGPDTLLVIDELGAGTDPDEGAAIGRAVVEDLLQRRCPALITTHLGVLKSIAYSAPRAENACVDFDVETLRPTYHLRIGEPGNSNAINIAARLGLPQHLVDAARSHLTASHEQLTRAIRGTLASRRLAEQARSEAETVKAAAEKELAVAKQEAASLREQQEAFNRWASAVAALKPGDKVHVRKFDREGRIVRVMLHKQQAVVSVGAMEMELPLRELSPMG